MRRRGCDSRRALQFLSSIFHPRSSVFTGGTCAVAARLPRKKSAMGATPFASTNSRKGVWGDGVLGGNGGHPKRNAPFSHHPITPNSSRVMIRRVGCNPAVVKRSGSRRVVRYHHHPPI